MIDATQFYHYSMSCAAPWRYFASKLPAIFKSHQISQHTDELLYWCRATCLSVNILLCIAYLRPHWRITLQVCAACSNEHNILTLTNAAEILYKCVQHVPICNEHNTLIISRTLTHTGELLYKCALLVQM